MHKSIVIDHLCRVEGHGGITVNIKDGKVSEVNMDNYAGSAKNYDNAELDSWQGDY